jgi:hypothetical protein
MNRLSYFYLALSLFGCFKLNAAAPIVLVEHQGKYQGYFEKPRLGLVVTQVSNAAPFYYWPAAKLFKVDVETKQKLEQQRVFVLEQLTALKQTFQQDNEFELATSAEKLERDITSWELAGRMMLPLDPDRVRAKKSLNPLLTAGQYKLVVASRPTEIQIEGLAAEEKMPLLNAASVDTYLTSLSVLEGGSTSFVYVIPALDQFFVAKTGLWNKSYQEISAGSVLFIPFEQRHLPTAFSDINEQVVELLLHKVVAQ